MIMIIAITGAMGSGKSTVANFFSARGVSQGLISLRLRCAFGTKQRSAEIIDVDKLGWEILKEKKIKEMILNSFGNEVFSDKGEINRKKLGRIVFGNRNKKRIIDNLVHPLLLRKLKNRINSLTPKLPNSKTVVVDCALVYKWGIEDWFDKIILVRADYNLRIKRLIDSGYKKEDAENYIKGQDFREGKADFIIENNGDLTDLENKAREVFTLLSI